VFEKEMGQSIQQSFVIPDEEFLSSLTNHKCVYEPHLTVIGKTVSMSKKFYSTILDLSNREIKSWIIRVPSPSNDGWRDEQPVTIRLSLSWILQKNTLTWDTRRVFHEVSKLHPGNIPEYNDFHEHLSTTFDPEPVFREDTCIWSKHSICDITVSMSPSFHFEIVKLCKVNLKNWYRHNNVVPNDVEVQVRVWLSWIIQRNTLQWGVENVYNVTAKLHPRTRFLL
jgi:hypothetical protein